MSWDISIQDFPGDVQRVEDIPDDFMPKPLGARAEVIAKTHQVLPQVDFSNPAWGLLVEAEFSIEFNMGNDGICDSFMLHVRGGGSAAAVIARLLEHLRLRGIDCQTGEFFAIAAAQESFREWQAYRDRVVGGQDTE